MPHEATAVKYKQHSFHWALQNLLNAGVLMARDCKPVGLIWKTQNLFFYWIHLPLQASKRRNITLWMNYSQLLNKATEGLHVDATLFWGIASQKSWDPLGLKWLELASSIMETKLDILYLHFHLTSQNLYLLYWAQCSLKKLPKQ